MGRAIGGAVVGYITMFVIIFAAVTGLWNLLGADVAFAPGVFDLSFTWLMISLALGALGAYVAGIIARGIARSSLGPKVLAVIIVVLGIGGALPMMMAEPSAVAREATTTMVDALSMARSPVWFALLSPIASAFAALLAGKALTSSPTA